MHSIHKLMEDQIRNSTMRLSTSKSNFTENIFQKQKNIIDKEKKKISLILADLTSEPTQKEITNAFIFIVFSELNQKWEYSSFTTEPKFGEETPIIKNSKWSPTDNTIGDKGFELRNLIFKSKDKINYRIVNARVFSYFQLKGESSFWLIFHTNEQFDVTSSVITISKKENSQRVFVSFGTFVKDIHDNLIYKVFSRQQLLDYNDKKSRLSQETDTCSVQLEFEDKGEEFLKGKIYLNESKKENKISSGFFVPVIKDYSICLGGSGEMCNVKSFYCETEYKEKYINVARIQPKGGCDCCLVF